MCQRHALLLLACALSRRCVRVSLSAVPNCGIRMAHRAVVVPGLVMVHRFKVMMRRRLMMCRRLMVLCGCRMLLRVRHGSVSTMIVPGAR